MDRLINGVLRWLLDPHKFAEIVVVLALMTVALVLARRRHRPFFTRALRTDLMYAFLHFTPAFVLLIPVGRLVRAALRDHAQFAHLDLLAPLPWLAKGVVWIFLADFVHYWFHRTLHKTALWHVHAIHHSQRELTPITTWRLHMVEVLLEELTFVALGLLVGVPVPLWVALRVSLFAVSFASHLDADVSYGPLELLLVSPRIHGVHHSLAREDHEKNFGMIFTIWDRAFGTFKAPAGRPVAYGIEDPVPDGFLGQQAYPFVRPFRRLDAARAATPTRWP